MQHEDADTGTLLRRQRHDLAQAAVERQYRQQPELTDRYGASGYEKCVQDVGYHLDFLAEAVVVESPALFVDYIAWAKVTLAARGIPPDDLAASLACLRDVLRERLPGRPGDVAARYVEQSLRQLPELPAEPPAIEEGGPHADLARHYLGALLAADRREARRLVLDAAAHGVPVRDLYMHVFRRTQHEVGRLWQASRISVAQEHFCTAATQQAMTELYPRIFGTERNGRVMVMACVGSELHELGARMVADFFEMDGWDTFYLGANTPAAGIAETVAARRADVLGISATMTFHLRAVRETIAAVRADAATAGVRVLVGGYPFGIDPELWRRLGADGSARSAEEAVALANAFFEDQ